ncbi:MAG: LA2681 family HEPN domain-containing protein [Woeseia sp.]
MTASRPPTLDELIEKPIDGVKNQKALDHIGLLIDASCDHKSGAGTSRAFDLLEQVRTRKLSAKQQATAHYFTANAWGNKRAERENAGAWAWEQPEVHAQILELRNAVRHEGFKKVPAVLRCRILTNLANQFSFIGRFIEAAEMWDRALTEDGQFGMALGNHGVGLASYAHELYDPGHAAVIFTAAHDLLSRAAASTSFDVGDTQARAYFEIYREKIEERVDVCAIRKKLAKRRHSIGRTARERAYRRWCLANRLFLNPLNDLGAVTIASRDPLTLPSLTTPVGSEMPWVFGFFNQMKQELVSARFMLYEGLQGDKVHFSDRSVTLGNTLDYPSYSLAVERQRAAFRVAYSLLDKVGYFINDYFALGHNPRSIYFRTVWFEANGGTPKPLHQRFATSQNWMLRGLFWLSKDLFDEELKASTDPDSHALDTIRNHLEHKYLQVHESWAFDPLQMTEGLCEHRYSVSRDDFGLKTLTLLKLARAALIYLSLAIHREERQRPGSEGALASMIVDDWDDDWKR